MVGFVRRLRPWLGIGAIEGGLGLVVSRSVRIPLAWSDLQRAGVFEHGGESGLALELRDPRAFADALQPDVTHDLLRILRRELGRQVVDAERPSLGDSLRRTRDKTGFDLIIPERKLGGATASGAAAAIGQQILKARWDLAMSAGETAAATRDR
jgi:hypothetical protein